MKILRSTGSDLGCATWEEMDVLRCALRGDVVVAAAEREMDMTTLRSILAVPCGTLRSYLPHQEPGYRPPTYSAFTIEEIGCYIFPAQGLVYIAIDGDVYNIECECSSIPALHLC